MTIQQFSAGQTLTAAQMNALQESDFNYTVNTQSGTSYTLLASDLGKLVKFTNSGAIVLTVPTDVSVSFGVGDRITLMLDSTGTLTVQGASGVTVNSEGGILELNTRYSIATLVKMAADSWILTGVMMNTITDAEVTESKIASGAVTEAKIGTGAVTSAKIADGTIVNADINASAAIAHSKLANATAGQVLLGTTTTGVVTATTVSGDVTITGGGVTSIGSGVIVDADVNASAAIAHSKLANVTAGQVLLGNASNVPTATALSGDVTVNSTGVTAIASGVVVNADINASAAIELSKLATSTAGNIIVYNSSGVPTAVAETGDVTIDSSGVTSISSSVIVNADISASAAIAHSKLANATAGQVLLGTTTTGVVTATTVSGDVTITGAGVTAIGSNVIVNADINASAAIALSKLATSTPGNIIVYNSSGVPTSVEETGDVTISDTGVTSIASGVIINADVNASAAISYSKLNLSNSLVNADISSSAAIEISKIADVTIDTKTANYTLALTDKNKFIEMNLSSANTVSVPTNGNVAFPVGSQIHITQYGTGKTQIVAVTPATTTIRSTPGTYLRAQYSSATLIKRATDEWYLVGDLSAT